MHITTLFDPRCAHHPEMRRNEHGLCDFCLLTARRDLLPQPSAEQKRWTEKLSGYARPLTFRSEAETYDEGIWDDD